MTSTTFDLVLANVENTAATLANVKPHGDVLLLNEVKPFRRRIKRRWVRWRSRFADTNAILWKHGGTLHAQTWRRQILPAKRGRWQDSWALAVHLRIKGHDCLFVVTHFPSKAFTTMPWRRKGWRTAKVELERFVDDVCAEIAEAFPYNSNMPVILGGDFNRGRTDWNLRGFRLSAAPVTYGRRGRYDRVFTRGPVEVFGVRARRLGSPHRTVTAQVHILGPEAAS